MSFLTGNVLGSCACRQIPEAQMVFASVPYPVGFVKNAPLTRLDPEDTYPPGYTPICTPIFPIAFDKCYLTADCLAVNSDGSTLAWSVSYSHLDGYRTASGELEAYPPAGFDGGGDGNPTDWIWLDEVTVRQIWPNGASVTYTLSNPWTYEEALAAAIELLAAVDLLNPTRTYTAPDASTFQLKYPSETGSAGTGPDMWLNNQVCISQNLHRAEDGTPGTLTTDLNYFGNNAYGWRPADASDNYNTAGQVTPDIEAQGIMPNGWPFAFNGYIHATATGFSRLWVSKMAFRGPRRLNFRAQYLLNFEDFYIERVPYSVDHMGGDITYIGEAPLLLFPGEHIFSHTDGAAGIVRWTNAPTTPEPAGGAGDTQSNAGGNPNQANL